MSLDRSERWTIGLSLISVLIATVGTLFAGYQSYLTREALLSSKVLNLQAKEVEHCEALLAALSNFGREFEMQTKLSEKNRTFGLNAGMESPGSNQDLAALGDAFTEAFAVSSNGRLAQAATQVGNSVDLLSIYAGAETGDALKSIAEKAQMASMLFGLKYAAQSIGFDGAASYPSGSPEEFVAGMHSSTEPIVGKCKAAVLGQIQGLI